MRSGVLALMMSAACASSQSGGGGPAAPLSAPAYTALAVPADTSHPVPREHARLARALGVPALGGHAVPGGAREVRLSTGSPMAIGWEWPLVRLVETAGSVTGEVWLARGVPDAPGGIVVRRARAVPGIVWHAVLARVDSARLLPGPAVRPSGGIMDGGELFVEVRTGGVYASRWYNAPSARARQDSVFGPAARVAALVDSLGRAAAGR